MGIHFDKIVPVIIAVVLIYLNTRKKSKKQSTASKPPSNEAANSQPSAGHDIFNPFFKGLDNILNINQPVVQTITEPEPQVIQTKLKKEPVAPEPVARQSVPANVVFHEPVVNVEHFDFDARRAFIDAEIFNRKYFTI